MSYQNHAADCVTYLPILLIPIFSPLKSAILWYRESFPIKSRFQLQTLPPEQFQPTGDSRPGQRSLDIHSNQVIMIRALYINPQSSALASECNGDR